MTVGKPGPSSGMVRVAVRGDRETADGAPGPHLEEAQLRVVGPEVVAPGSGGRVKARGKG